MLNQEDKKQIEVDLEDLFDLPHMDGLCALKTYFLILENGYEITEHEIAKEINSWIVEGKGNESSVALGKVSQTITQLTQNGFILERPRKGKKLNCFLINPEMLYYMSYVAKKLKDERVSLKDYLGNPIRSHTISKLKQMWEENEVGLGKAQAIIQVQGWTNYITLTHVCGWISALKELPSVGQISLLTPNLHLLKQPVEEFFMGVLSGLKNCECDFFIQKDELEKKEAELMSFFRKLNESTSESSESFIQHRINPVGKFMFPSHIRVVILGNNLGSIFLKRQDHYVGEIYYKSPERIKDLKDCLAAIKKC